MANGPGTNATTLPTGSNADGTAGPRPGAGEVQNQESQDQDGPSPVVGLVAQATGANPANDVNNGEQNNEDPNREWTPEEWASWNSGGWHGGTWGNVNNNWNYSNPNGQANGNQGGTAGGRNNYDARRKLSEKMLEECYARIKWEEKHQFHHPYFQKAISAHFKGVIPGTKKAENGAGSESPENKAAAAENRGETSPKSNPVPTPASPEAAILNGSGWLMRAAQGHTLNEVESDALLRPFTLEMLKNASETGDASLCHGTYQSKLGIIMETGGLCSMGRNHIHFFIHKPVEGGGKKVISGARSDADCYIHLDLAKCLQSGLKFYISENGVVLTSGTPGKGMLSSLYFDRVEAAENVNGESTPRGNAAADGDSGKSKLPLGPMSEYKHSESAIELYREDQGVMSTLGKLLQEGGAKSHLNLRRDGLNGLRFPR